MTVNYTTNLALGQPVTGTESGTWGDDVNNAVTSYLDIAIAGGLSVTVTTADVTLTLTQGTSVATNIGSTTAQYAILNVSGAMTAARNLILPSSSRQYVINNACTGGFLLTVKGSATTGVTLVNGEKAHVFWTGTDYSKLSNTPGGAGTFSSITNTGLTSGRVVFSTTAGLETDSAGLTFDGTNFATTGTATAAKLIPTGSSATGNGLYLPAANSVGLSTNGTNAVYIDSTQNVGIGISSPGSKLEVRSGYITSGTTPSTDGAKILAGYYSSGSIATLGGEYSNGGPILGYGVWPSTSAAAAFVSSTTINVSRGAYTILGSSHIWYSGTTQTVAIDSPVTTSEVMRVDFTGLGVGTSAPGTRLDLGTAASSGITMRYDTTTSYRALITPYWITSTDTRIDFAINSLANVTPTVFLSLGYAGNVGVGTTTPNKKLTVYQNQNGLRLNHDFTTADYSELSFSSLGLAGNGAGIRSYRTSTTYNGNEGDLRFYTNTGSGGASSDGVEAMRIHSDGKVGIGLSTTPDTKLHVSASDSTNAVGSSDASINITNTYTGAYGFSSDLIFAVGGGVSAKLAGISAIYNTYSTSPGGALVFYTNDGSSSFTEKMRISAAGNVGINKILPTATLDVVGIVTVAASTAASNGFGFQVTQASGADRDVLLAGVNGVSNGLTVRYVSSAMEYTMTGLGTGTVTSTAGVLSAVSDQNMKVADGEIENAIDKVLSLKPRYFYWKDKDGNADTAKRRQLGFYAQEVNAVVPEASPEPIKEDDGWGVYDRSLVATLVKAMQEQQALITSLTARITALEST